MIFRILHNYFSFITACQIFIIGDFYNTSVHIYTGML